MTDDKYGWLPPAYADLLRQADHEEELAKQRAQPPAEPPPPPAQDVRRPPPAQPTVGPIDDEDDDDPYYRRDSWISSDEPQTHQGEKWSKQWHPPAIGGDT
ncbi:hypothetical protein GZH49_12570 [Nocardia terpenica]|uniref:hypothetical protein n=1 Tax=Nocardia terpenica TaxID=455432 RepID=UPI002FE2D855